MFSEKNSELRCDKAKERVSESRIVQRGRNPTQSSSTFNAPAN